MVFGLDLGQISFDPVENAFVTQQLAFLAGRIAFYHILTRASAEIKLLDEKVTYVLRRNPIKDGAISGFKGQKSVPE